MIQIEFMTVRETRGIRDLELQLDRKSLVIFGPNGSGKSGVVDAIEFALTGDMSRLAGKGTGGVSLGRHGPHVDRRDDPESAEVTLGLYLLRSKQSVTLTRNLRRPKEFLISPDTPAIRAEIVEASSHPEFVLSRREVIKYVVAEAGQRSKEVQALLRLDGIGEIRNALKTAQNRTRNAHEQAAVAVRSAGDSLKRHLDVDPITSTAILEKVNERRGILGLAPIEALNRDTALDKDLQTGVAGRVFNKETALRDIGALRTAIDGAASLAAADTAALLESLRKLREDPSLLDLLARQEFIQRGLAFIDSEACPLCDLTWPSQEALKEHLSAKLAKSRSAATLRSEIDAQVRTITGHLRRLRDLVTAVNPIAEQKVAGLSASLSAWSSDLEGFASRLSTLEGLVGEEPRLAAGWVNVPQPVTEGVDNLLATVQAEPDQSALASAHSFLVLAQERYQAYRAARRSAASAKQRHTLGEFGYRVYCEESERILGDLYKAVEADFSDFYRFVNADDEGSFKARFIPQEGKLDLSVDFYGKGMFPPAAYHSEGHQDGMGVCLYLALMRRVLGGEFRLAVLDDVVMSVDSGHRRQFCKLLKERFPNTQFIVTTHDPVWARQMRTEGIVENKATVQFHGWTVATGPIYAAVAEAWERIDSDLARDDTPSAAATLRRHLEYVCTELAESLAAPVPFRGDAAYDLGALFPAIIGRYADVLKEAGRAAISWKDDAATATVEAMKDARKAAVVRYGDEQWLINRAVHFNEWASLSKEDFEPVVSAVKALLAQLECEKCNGWLQVVPPRGPGPQELRCRCAGVHLNLTGKG